MARIYVLGAGNPVPTPERFGSSYVLQLGDEHIMFDCGPAATHKLARSGLLPAQIGYLFFTHHHFDHDVDYPCFLLTRWDQGIGSEKLLEVLGPAPTEKLTHRLLDEKEGAFAHDWIARINWPVSQQIHVSRGGTLPRKPPTVEAKDIGTGKVYSGNGWEVTSAVAEHAQPWLDSLAYRVDSSEGSVVFTGDTRPCQSVVDLSAGADVMLCNCSAGGREEKTTDSQRTYGAVDAARMAQQARVGRLVLVHIGPALAQRGVLQESIRAARKVYDGEIVVSRELTSLHT